MPNDSQFDLVRTVILSPSQWESYNRLLQDSDSQATPTNGRYVIQSTRNTAWRQLTRTENTFWRSQPDGGHSEYWWKGKPSKPEKYDAPRLKRWDLEPHAIDASCVWEQVSEPKTSESSSTDSTQPSLSPSDGQMGAQ